MKHSHSIGYNFVYVNIEAKSYDIICLKVCGHVNIISMCLVMSHYTIIPLLLLSRAPLLYEGFPLEVGCGD